MWQFHDSGAGLYCDMYGSSGECFFFLFVFYPRTQLSMALTQIFVLHRTSEGNIALFTPKYMYIY